MGDLNLTLLSLNKRHSSPDKKHNLSLRLVLFFPFLCCFAGSIQSSTAKQMKLFNSNFQDVFYFFYEKNTPRKLFLFECLRSALQTASAYERREFWAKLTHLCDFWLDVSFFSHVKKHRSRFLLDLSFFSRVKTIARSSDWLELICLWMFMTSLFGEYFSVCIEYIKKK